MPSLDHRTHSKLTPFRVDVHPERDVVRVAAVGELDLLTVAQLQTQIDELREAGFERVVLDLRQLTFMDSTGVALILEEDRIARSSGCEFSIISGAPAIQDVLEVCCGDELPRLCVPGSRRSRALRARTPPAVQDRPVLSRGMRRYLGGLRHQARPRRHAAP